MQSILTDIVIVSAIVSLCGIVYKINTKGKVKYKTLGETVLDAIIAGNRHKWLTDDSVIIASEHGPVAFTVESVGKDHLYIKGNNRYRHEHGAMIDTCKGLLDNLGGRKSYKMDGDQVLVVNDFGNNASLRLTYSNDRANCKLYFITTNNIDYTTK